MLKEIDFGKVHKANRLYSLTAQRGDWYVKDGVIHFWKVYFDGGYAVELIEPSELDNFIRRWNPLERENLTEEKNVKA